MNRISRKVIVTAVALLPALAAPQAYAFVPGNIVENFSFDQPMNFWNIETGSQSIYVSQGGQSGDLSDINPFYGDWMVELQGLQVEGAGRISQVIPTEIGATYDLGFLYNLRDPLGTQDDWEINVQVGDIGSLIVDEIVTIPDTDTGTPPGWTLSLRSFVANSTGTRIALEGDDNGYPSSWGPVVDDFYAVKTANAIPAPMGLSGGALLFAGVAMRRRRPRANG